MTMRIVDCHFHWYPRSVFDQVFCKRKAYPRCVPNGKRGYVQWTQEGVYHAGALAEYFDLDAQLAHMDSTGFDVETVCSIGPYSAHFSAYPAAEGRDAAMMWNEEMAAAQRKHAGRFWASAAVTLADTKMAIDELERAVTKLGLIGVNIPGSVGLQGRIDDPRLEPFYDRVEQLGVPMFMHPTDLVYSGILDGYDGALHSSLGKVIDVSIATYRLVLSGIMERHPNLKVFMSHTGGALPYQAGRMDKNSKAAKLPKEPSEYLRRMYTDTVSPHAMGVRFAVDFYGVDHVMYGSDYPCWMPGPALEVFEKAGLSKAEQEKVFSTNARRFFGLKDPVKSESKPFVAA